MLPIMTPLAGIGGTAEPRAPEAPTTPEQGAAFAALLSGLMGVGRGVSGVATPEAAPAHDVVETELEAADAETADVESTATDAGALAVTERDDAPKDDAKRDRKEDAKNEELKGTDGTTPDALVAASRAMAATVAASLEPVRAPDALDPEFREKLGRVVSRLKELGHDVRVVETVRSQERQDRLFAQGRGAPGPVVTWTRRSRHTEGLAADLVIDGKFGGPAFRTMHRLAAEEGLRTLGAIDQGHVELARERDTLPSALGARPSADTKATLVGSLQAIEALGARVEEVATREARHPAVGARRSALGDALPAAERQQPAGVAAVAQVAHVARIAQVARVAEPARVAPAGEAKPTLATGPRTAAVRAAREDREPSAEESLSRAQSREGPTAEGLAALASAMTAASPRAFGAALAEAQGLVGVDVGGRVERVLAAQEAARSGYMSELTLALDAPDGGVDRIRVGVTGRAVGATLAMGDAGGAAQVGARLDELTRALERVGLEPEAVRVAQGDLREPVRDVIREAAAREAVRHAAPTATDAGRGAGADDRQHSHTPRERDAWSHDDRRQQQRQDGRHRSRREQQETSE